MSGKRIAILAAACLLLCATIVGIVGQASFGAWLSRADAAILALGPRGWLVFALLQALVALVGVVPASLLGVAAGAVYGIVLGFALSAFGVMAGALGAFWLARSFARPLIAARLSGRLARFDAAVTDEGLRFVCLLRVSPVLPFSIASYAFGLSGVSTGAYIIGTVASLPALLGYVAIGAFGAAGLSAAGFGAAHAGAPEAIRDALIAVGVIATALLAVHLSRLLARAARPAQ
jgi:uncharacterized membrane protein YdjX (TVP38/TMEM64 family)